MILIIKCPKEMILTSKLRRELKIYLVPINTDGVDTYGLVTAFFDDPDEPLVIRTFLSNDEIAANIFDLLSSSTFNVHFIDEHNRELLGYRVKNLGVDKFGLRLDDLCLAPPDYIPSSKIDDQISKWFSNRNSDDDDQALVIEMMEELFPDDIFVMDTRPKDNSYHGRKTPMITSLGRETPGIFSELDIVKCLDRVFSSDQIYLNPVRTDDGKEFVDIMVVTSSNLLLIQAKDSPNTEYILNRPIERKISTVVRHLKKAAAQMRGSISYLRSNKSLKIRCGTVKHNISVGHLNITALILVKELFTTEYKVYSQVAFELFENTGIPFFIQDYSEFHQFTHHSRTENRFFNLLDRVLQFAYQHDEFPRSRY